VRQPYEAPEIVYLGSVHEVTQGLNWTRQQDSIFGVVTIPVGGTPVHS
jgi:hypothetical protein